MLQPQSTKKVEARASPSGSVSVSEHPSKTKLRAHALAIILKYETKTNVCGIMVLDQYFKTDNNVFENVLITMFLKTTISPRVTRNCQF